MNNIENIRELEETMNANRAEMQSINKLFTAVYWICMVPTLIFIVVGLVMLAALAMTIGMAEYDIPPIAALEWLASIGAAVLFGMSHAKYKKFTYGSVAILLFLSILEAIDGDIPIIYMLLAILQCFCAMQYNRIDYLKEQPGYPDFNASLFVSAVADNNRRLTDNDVKAQLSQNRENRQAIRIDDVPDEMPCLEVPDESEYLTEREIADRKMDDIFKE